MNTLRTNARLFLLAGVAAGLGCSDGGSVDIGSTQAIGAQLSDYAATWDGYAQAYTFADGSDRVRVTIDSNGQGFLRVGDSPPLPAPTDPMVGYPPGDQGMFSTGGGANPPLPSFSYPLHAANVQSARIQLGVDLDDLYIAWCAIQTPVALTTNPSGGYGGYGCAPSFTKIDHPSPDSPLCTLYMPDGTSETADCGWLSLCELGPVCTCTETACSVTTEPRGTQVQLDGALDATGSTLTGTLTVGGRVNVILQKQN